MLVRLAPPSAVAAHILAPPATAKWRGFAVHPAGLPLAVATWIGMQTFAVFVAVRDLAGAGGWLWIVFGPMLLTAALSWGSWMQWRPEPPAGSVQVRVGRWVRVAGPWGVAAWPKEDVRIEAGGSWQTLHLGDWWLVLDGEAELPGLDAAI